MLLSVDGCAISYDVQGKGDPVLLIHGTAASVWGDTPAALARTHRVIRYDRRSFGASVHRPLGDLPRHAADAAALLDAVAGPAIVVGWSIGGVIALELALSRPDLVRGLVLLEPPLHGKRHASLSMLSAIGGALVLGALGAPVRGARRFLRWALARRDGDGLAMLPPDVRGAMLDNAAAIVGELGGGTGEHLDRARLASLRVPIALRVGALSNSSFHAAADRLVEILPPIDRRDVAGAGHCLQLDAPGEVLRAVAGVANDCQLVMTPGAHTVAACASSVRR
jgi:pimeloyl-ACP methyl ester carboxylesterase